MKKAVKRGCLGMTMLFLILLSIGAAAALQFVGPLLNEGANVLILFNNTDEMRGSGGFTTAYMTITRKDGSFVTHMGSSYEIDTPPTTSGAVLAVPPPRPMHDYMGIDRWSFRDANWSPDYPTSAQAASTFYTQVTKAQPPLYVITVNMSALNTLMQHLPPLAIEGQSIDALPYACLIQRDQSKFLDAACNPSFTDVLTWMRQAWNASASGPQGDKSFIGDKARQLVAAIRALPFSDQLSIIPTINEMLIRGDVLLYSSDADLQTFFATRRWSGPFPFSQQGHTLLYSENNIGYNKTSSSLRRDVVYTVDFTQSSPRATLTITYKSGSPALSTDVGSLVPIDPRLQTCHDVDSVGALQLGVPSYENRMVGCARIYAMIYPMPGSKLIDYDVPSTPADQFPFGLRGQTGRIDALRDAGVNGWGYVLVIPYGETRTVKLTYTLPASLTNTDDTINLPTIGDMNAIWHIEITAANGVPRTLNYDVSNHTFSDRKAN